MSPELRDALLPHGFKTVQELGAKYLELDSHAGERGVALPGEKATDDDWQRFHEAIGVPKDAKEYGSFEFDGQQADPNMDKFARELFPKAGVTKRGAELLVKGWNKMVASVVEAKHAADAAAEAKGMENLGKVWGGETRARLDVATRAADYFQLSAQDVAAMRATLGVEKAMGFLYAIGNAVATDGDNPDGGETPFNVLTPQGAKAEYARMQKDPRIGAILRDPNHKEHKVVKAKWERLLDRSSQAR